MFHLLRTIFWLIPAIAIYTIVLGALSIGSSVFDGRGYLGHWCARAWSWLILTTTGVRVSITGLDRLSPGKTYVFASNHQSIYDIPILFTSLPYQLRIISKEAIGRFPVLGWHLRRTGHFLVDRKRPDPKAVFRWANALTSKGLSLIIFPEGTRSRDGHVGPFKGGPFYVGVQAGLAIVPISVIGSRHVMRKGELTTRPGDVRVIVHDPIPTEASAEPDMREVRRLAASVRAIIAPPVEEEAQARAVPGG